MRRALIAIVAVLVACGLFGCGQPAVEDSTQQDEVAIREGISCDLDMLCSPSAEDVASLFDVENDEECSQLYEEYGIDLCEVVCRAFRGFTYSVESVSVEGDAARATVRITSLDCSVAAANAAAAMGDQSVLENTSRMYSSVDESAMDELVSYSFGILCDELDATNETVESELTMTLNKRDNEWSLDSQSLGDVLEAVTQGL